MLYENPPFPVVNGVALFPDHANPLLFYYLPLAPKLTEVTDPQTRQQIPQFQLVKYRGQAGTGGFLNFDVNIGVNGDQLDDIAQQLEQMLRLKDKPVLSPAPLIDGTVKMMLFGKQTGDKPPAPGSGTPDQPQFVLKIDQNAKPALYGDNQAAFSVALDKDGVTVLEAAMQGEMSPIGIVYSLDYLALRPAYTVSINVDWDRVQKHMDESFGANTIFFSSQIDKTVDELIDKRLIDIQVDTFVPEGDDTGVIARRDQAVNEVKEMITESFFKPSLDPWQEKKDDWDKAADFIDRISRTAATGGMGGDSLFSYKKMDYTRIDKKTLNMKMNERTTVKRSIYPQGHLSGIFRTLKREGLDLSKFVISADLDNPFFQRRTVTAISRANYDEDSIASIDAIVKYGDNPKNAVLDPTTTSKTMEWSSILTDGAMKRDATASYKVTFKDANATDRPVVLESKPLMLDIDTFEINPRELYSIVHVKIIALGFPWDRYSAVEVQTRYADDANHLKSVATFLLQKDKAEATWTLFVLDPAKTSFTYKVIFRAIDNRDLEMPWVETDQEQVTVRNPFPKQLRVDLAASSSLWIDTERVFADVSYDDPDNAISASKSYTFDKTHATDAFVVDLADATKRLVSYSITYMMLNGTTFEVPRSATRLPRIIISRVMKGHKIIQVHPKPVDFAGKNLAKITVELRYQSAQESASDIFNFESKDGVEYFEFDYVDPQASKYTYQVTYLYTNGLTRATDWLQSEAEDLALAVE